MTTRAQPTPKQLMASAQRMLADATSHWDDFHDAISEVLEVPMASGFGANGHSSDISDPTSSVALASGRLYWSTKLSDAEAQAIEAHAHVKALLAIMSARPVMAVDPKMKRLSRCSDAVCEELAVAKGMCATHWRAARRAELKEQTA